MRAGFAWGVGGLDGVGAGMASNGAWLVAAAVLALLALLAWWTLRPARRATRAEVRRARDATPAGERGPDYG